MTSRNLLNIILGVVLLGLLALAIYEPGKPEAPAAERLTALMPDAVQRISIKSTNRAPLVLVKKSAEWQMQSPLTMYANTGRVEALLKVLRAKSVAQYPMSRVDANQLQLDAPNLTLSFDDVVLRFGNTEALGGSRYVQVGNTVHLITDRYSHLAKGAATDFVDPVLLPAGSVIDELVLPGLHLTQREGHWAIDGQSADADAIQSLLNEWRHARALRVTALEKAEVSAKAGESIAVTLGNATDSAVKQVLQFTQVRNDSEIILQRPALGIQYHFPVEAGERLLSLPTTDKAPAQ